MLGEHRTSFLYLQKSIIMSLRDFWRKEADKLRDKSAILDNIKNVLDTSHLTPTSTQNRELPISILLTPKKVLASGGGYVGGSTDDSDGVVNILFSAERTNAMIFPIAETGISDMSINCIKYDKMNEIKEKYLIDTPILNNLFVLGHGSGDHEKPIFRIGDDIFTTPEEVYYNSKRLAAIGQVFKGSIVLLTCNSAGNGELGEKLLAALAKCTRKWVLGCKSWIAAYNYAFGEEKGALGKWLDYLDTESKRPKTGDHEVDYYKYMMGNGGCWIAASPRGRITPFDRLRINYDGNFQWAVPSYDIFKNY
jgi:hypothetical protein